MNVVIAVVPRELHTIMREQCIVEVEAKTKSAHNLAYRRCAVAVSGHCTWEQNRIQRSLPNAQNEIVS